MLSLHDKKYVCQISYKNNHFPGFIEAIMPPIRGGVPERPILNSVNKRSDILRKGKLCNKT